MGMGMDISFQYPMGMDTDMGVIFENRYGCRYNSTRPKSTPLPFPFMVHLLHIKCLCGRSDKPLIIILDPLKRAFDYDDTYPKNAYKAK